MEAFDKGLEKVVTALAYLASAIIPCIFTMIVIDVSIRTIGITPPLFTSSIVEYGLLYVACFPRPGWCGKKAMWRLRLWCQYCRQVSNSRLRSSCT